MRDDDEVIAEHSAEPPAIVTARDRLRLTDGTAASITRTVMLAAPGYRANLTAHRGRVFVVLSPAGPGARLRRLAPAWIRRRWGGLQRKVDEAMARSVSVGMRWSAVIL